MTQVNYRVRLSGRDIDGSDVACLGAHVVRVLDVLDAELGAVVWYAADVDAAQELPQPLADCRDFQPQRIGATSDLRAAAADVDQFLSGVFLAVPAQIAPTRFPSLIGTEDPPFRSAAPAVIELRMFDTTNIEIYAAEPRRLRSLSETFHAPIETSENGPL